MNSMIRFSPSNELRRLQREIDSVFQNMYPSDKDREAPVTGWTPRVDLSETEDAYHIHLDLPGVQKEDVDINLQDGTLTIRGERKEEQRAEGSNSVRVERSFGQFFRSFALPQTIQQEGIQASFDNGVLSVEVPKAEETKPRRIEIS